MNMNSRLSYNCLDAAKAIWMETQPVSYINVFRLMVTHFLLYYIILYFS